MSSYQSVTILGQLGRDPEVNGTVTRLSIATSEKWTDKSGQKQERTEWHRVAAFGKTGELAAKYLQKGRTVLIEGRLRTSQYEKNGEKRYSTDIIADRVVFVGSGSGQAPSSRSETEDPTGGYEPEDPPADDQVPF